MCHSKEFSLVSKQGKALRQTEISQLFVCTSFRIVWFLKFGKFLEISWFFELAKISQKNCLEISSGQKLGFWGQKLGFPNILNLQNLFISELSKKYKNMTLKLNFENCEKLVQTRILTQTFECKFRMHALIEGSKSSC